MQSFSKCNTMAALLASLVLIISVNLISAYVLLSDENQELIWPTEFHFTGESISFQTTIKTPIEIWSSSQHNMARIDYFGGTSKLFFNGENNSTYMVIPVADKELNVDIYCWMAEEGKEAMELPDASSFSFTGQTTSLFDKVVDMWTSQSIDENELFVDETLYVYKTVPGVDVPVQHIKKKLNVKSGEIMSHTITNYYNFENAITAEDVLNQPEDCVLAPTFEKTFHLLHPDLPGHLNHAFESFASHHGKNYHVTEKEMRKRIFEENWRKVQEHNAKDLSFKLAVNEFSDRTPEELKHLTGLLGSGQPSKLALPFPHTLEEVNDIVDELPENFDLRMEGAVTRVKHQGHCGSCWAFATSAALEGAFARVNGDRLLDFSEQSIVDCAWGEGNMGCHGGLLDDAWKYILDNGIVVESDYGVYTAHDGYCNLPNMTNVYKIKGFAHVTPRSPNALKVALYKYGPVTIGVKATDTMMHYSHGLFYDFSCDPGKSRPNHAVTVVGYGTRDGDDYWLVKNSWGESWGEDGYILMSAKNNNCYVLDYPVYPVV